MSYVPLITPWALLNLWKAKNELTFYFIWLMSLTNNHMSVYSGLRKYQFDGQQRFLKMFCDLNISSCDQKPKVNIKCCRCQSDSNLGGVWSDIDIGWNFLRFISLPSTSHMSIRMAKWGVKGKILELGFHHQIGRQNFRIIPTRNTDETTTHALIQARWYF